MKVREVGVTSIAFPDAPLLIASGVHQPWALRTIVEVDCGDGLVGLGETYGDAPHLALLRTTAQLLTGMDPFDTNGLAHRVQQATAGARRHRVHP